MFRVLSTLCAVAAGTFLRPRTRMPVSHGFRIAFDGVPSLGLGARSAEGASLRREEEDFWPFSTPPLQDDGPSRLLMYDFPQHAGLDDRISLLTALNGMAHKLHAQLVFPDPDHSLGRTHGNTTAEWWDEYFDIQPKVLRLGEEHCAPSALEVNLTKPELLDALNSTTKARVLNPNVSICLRIQINCWSFDKGSSLYKKMQQSWDDGDVVVRTSPRVTHLVDRLRKDLFAVNGHYNAIHIRRGDHGIYDCNEPTNAIVRMVKLTDQYPEYRRYPWLLMSDGEPEFYDKIESMAKLNHMHVIPEGNLTTLSVLRDDFQRYLVLECAFNGATLAINTFKRAFASRCEDVESAAAPEQVTQELLCR